MIVSFHERKKFPSFDSDLRNGDIFAQDNHKHTSIDDVNQQLYCVIEGIKSSASEI